MCVGGGSAQQQALSVGVRVVGSVETSQWISTLEATDLCGLALAPEAPATPTSGWHSEEVLGKDVCTHSGTHATCK